MNMPHIILGEIFFRPFSDDSWTSLPKVRHPDGTVTHLMGGPTREVDKRIREAIDAWVPPTEQQIADAKYARDWS